MKKSKNAKVPHIGWTQTFSSKNKENWQKHLNNAFYYIHSYSFISRNEEDNLATINRDSKKITAAIYRKKLLGLQFHPEKSQIT